MTVFLRKFLYWNWRNLQGISEEIRGENHAKFSGRAPDLSQIIPRRIPEIILTKKSEWGPGEIAEKNLGKCLEKFLEDFLGKLLKEFMGKFPKSIFIFFLAIPDGISEDITGWITGKISEEVLGQIAEGIFVKMSGDIKKNLGMFVNGNSGEFFIGIYRGAK